VRRSAALAVSAAWHTEAFARTERPARTRAAAGTSRPRPHDGAKPRDRGGAGPEEQTPEEQLDVMRAIAASFKKGAE